MSSVVFIRGLRIEPVIGVYAWERELRQELRVDLEMAWDTVPAAASDDVADALNYAEVSQRLRSYAAHSSFQLLEALAAALAALVRDEFAVQWLRLRLSKPGAVAEADDVGVLIELGERPA
ncbi:MAG: dihydroneopterin aldolase [Halieaceae bacterium]|jgi:dihydroneopterin aldolase